MTFNSVLFKLLYLIISYYRLSACWLRSSVILSYRGSSLGSNPSSAVHRAAKFSTPVFLSVKRG